MSDDETLWQWFTKDIAPMKRNIFQKQPVLSEKPKTKSNKNEPSERVILQKQTKTQKKTPVLSCNAPIDRKTEDRLRKGQIDIDARIDLHGLTRHQAEDTLRSFLLSCHAQGKRNLLVITGKGNAKHSRDDWFGPGKGVIKTALPEWLGAPDIAPMILRFRSAHRKDGGDGATYIILRKNRDF